MSALKKILCPTLACCPFISMFSTCVVLWILQFQPSPYVFIIPVYFPYQMGSESLYLWGIKNTSPFLSIFICFSVGKTCLGKQPKYLSSFTFQSHYCWDCYPFCRFKQLYEWCFHFMLPNICCNWCNMQDTICYFGI